MLDRYESCTQYGPTLYRCWSKYPGTHTSCTEAIIRSVTSCPATRARERDTGQVLAANWIDPSIPILTIYGKFSKVTICL